MTKEIINTEKAPPAIGAYSQAVQLGDLIITSGQLPITVDGKLSDNVEEQARQSLQNLKAILEEKDLTMDDIVKCSVYIKDMNEFPKINEVYEKFFSKPYPARTCIEVARLPKDVKVEIEAIAIANKAK